MLLSGSRTVIKKPGEKRLTLFVRARHGRILELALTGDFFILPEEGVAHIEAALTGAKISRQRIVDTVRAVVEREGIELIGLSPETIAEGIVRICRGGM
jgi:lipoate---protein ligase